MALRVKLRNNGGLVRGTPFGVTYLYWKESTASGVGNLTDTTLLATNLAHNSPVTVA